MTFCTVVVGCPRAGRRRVEQGMTPIAALERNAGRLDPVFVAGSAELVGWAERLAMICTAYMRALAADRGIEDVEAVDRATALALYGAPIEQVERYVARDVAAGMEAIDWRTAQPAAGEWLEQERKS